MNMNWKTIVAPIITMSMMLTAVACSTSSSGGQESGGKSTESGKVTPSTESTVYPENGLPKDQKVTLKMGFFDGGNGKAYIDYAISTFEKKFPNVKFELTASPKINDLITTKIAANNDDDMFDLFTGDISGGEGAVVNLLKQGKLEVQDDLYDHKVYDGGGKTIRELAVDGLNESNPRYANKILAVPIFTTSAGMFYNKKLFEQNGWNRTPKTWSEFTNLLESIKTKGLIPLTYPGVYPYYLDSYGFGNYKMFEIADRNGNQKAFEDNYRSYNGSQYTSPESIEMWTKIYELGKKGYFAGGVAGLNHTQSEMLVLQGKAAMVLSGGWIENEMKASTPEGFEWGFFSVPMGDQDNGTIKLLNIVAGNSGFLWAKKPDLNKKWAKEFMVWQWNLDIQEKLVETGSVSVRKDYMNDSARAGRVKGLTKEMMEYAKNVKTKYVAPSRDINLTDPAVTTADKIMKEGMNDIALGKKEPKPILEAAEKELQKAIAASKK